MNARGGGIRMGQKYLFRNHVYYIVDSKILKTQSDIFRIFRGEDVELSFT